MQIGLPRIEAELQSVNRITRRCVRPASPALLSWLHERKLPTELIELFVRYSPHREIPVGSGYLHTAPDIVKVNDDYERTIPAGLLMVGGAPNGDPITIDFTTGDGATGYISHEEMWDTESPRSIFIPLASSIGEFIYQFNHDDDFAWDYWEAKRRRDENRVVSS